MKSSGNALHAAFCGFAFVPKNGYNREVAGRAAFHVRLRCDHR
jgi:hypothetical protein